MRVVILDDGRLHLEPENEHDPAVLRRLVDEKRVCGFGRDPESLDVIHAQIKPAERPGDETMSARHESWRECGRRLHNNATCACQVSEWAEAEINGRVMQGYFCCRCYAFRGRDGDRPGENIAVASERPVTPAAD